MFGSNLLPNLGEVVAMILFGIGFANLLLQKNLIKKIIGLNIMDTAVYLFLAIKGYIEGRSAPIVVDGVQEVEAYINPIPSGLVLTGIVVSVSVTALMLVKRAVKATRNFCRAINIGNIFTVKIIIYARMIDASFLFQIAYG